MELSVAIGLIEQGVDKTFTPQVWVDLGAGRRLFTRALADILPGGSTVYAIDKSATALKEIELLSSTVTLKKVQTDFVREEFVPEPPDGILMANALHFVENKIAFIKKIRKKLQP